MEDFDTRKLQDSMSSLQRSVNSLKVSSLLAANIEDLPSALRQLDACLQKSNENIVELKDSLKYVLERESLLRNDYEVLVQRYEFLKMFYTHKHTNTLTFYNKKVEKAENAGFKLKFLQEELESERKRIKEQDEELTSLHSKYISEYEKRISLEQENSKHRNTLEKLQETLTRLHAELESSKEEVVSLQSQRMDSENRLSDIQSYWESEQLKNKRLQINFAETQKEWEDRENKWNKNKEELYDRTQKLEREWKNAFKRVKELERQLKTAEENANRLKGENNELKAELESIDCDLERIRVKQEADSKEKIMLCKDLESFQKMLENKEEEISAIQSAKDRKGKELENKMNEMKEEYLRNIEKLNNKLAAQAEKQKELIKIVESSAEKEKEQTLRIQDFEKKVKCYDLQVKELNLQLDEKLENEGRAYEQLTEVEDALNQLSTKYQDALNRLENTETQYKALQLSHKKLEEKHSIDLANLKISLSEAESRYQDILDKAKSERGRYEKELHNYKKEYNIYELTSKKSQSEVQLWKAAFLDIICDKIVDRPRVEDTLRSLLGVAPERISGYDPDQAQYISNLSHRIKEVLKNERAVNTMDSGEVASRATQLLQEMTEKYRKEMAERRRLHKLLQDLRGNVRVMCRVRPLISQEKSYSECINVFDMCMVKIFNDSTRRETSYEFDRVFMPTDTQDIVYYEVSELVTNVMEGYNVCIMAYGQTGSGKTYTMDGNDHHVGINTRAVQEIFDMMEMRSDIFKYSVSITMLEVYNEQLRDLLDPRSKKIEIREDTDGRINVIGVNPVSVINFEHAIELMGVGRNNRSVGCTNVHEYSSRSHSIITLYIQAASDEKSFISKLNLIDLAGSERLSKTEAEGQRMVEACNINQSLSSLGKVLCALAAKQNHIPYRDSKLTHLLKDSLSGDAKTLMIVTVSPSPYDCSESISTLAFGSRVASIEKGRAKVDTKGKENKRSNSVSKPAARKLDRKGLLELKD
jgi:chromosome segregation ATPase